MNKRIVTVIIVCFVLFCTSYVYLLFNPIILSKQYAQNVFESPSDNLYNPIDTIDFTQGENKIIIYTNKGNLQFLPENMKKWTLSECTDNDVIEKVKKNFVFERISEDLVETTNSDSRIFFFKDNTLVFTAEMEIENEVISLYFRNTAWTFAINSQELISLFQVFKPIYIPIIKTY